MLFQLYIHITHRNSLFEIFSAPGSEVSLTRTTSKTSWGSTDLQTSAKNWLFSTNRRKQLGKPSALLDQIPESTHALSGYTLGVKQEIPTFMLDPSIS